MIYQMPTVEIEELAVEQGFAVSADPILNNPFGDEEIW